MIVLEGPDMAGKTTLATELFKRIVAMKTRHPMVRHFTKVQHHFDKYWGYRECCQRDVILDRFHLSHVVYRDVEDVEHHLTPLRYELVDAEISRMSGLVVVLAPPASTIEDRWVKNPRPEMYDKAHALKVADRFHWLASGASCGLISTRTGTYKPKMDLCFVSTIPTETMAEEIIKRWVQRQMELDNIIRQDPGELR